MVVVGATGALRVPGVRAKCGLQVSWRRAEPAEAGTSDLGTWVGLWRQVNPFVSVKSHALPRLEEGSKLVTGGRVQARSPQATMGMRWHSQGSQDA